MNLQQLKYAVTVAEAKSITKAASQLYIAQPSLSNAIRELEAEIGFAIFLRSRTGVTPTKEGMEFLGYARQVLQQMERLEDKYIAAQPRKTRFGVSTQHYTFTENAFVELVQRFGQQRYEFYFNEACTHQIIEDVKNRLSDLASSICPTKTKRPCERRLRSARWSSSPSSPQNPTYSCRGIIRWLGEMRSACLNFSPIRG